MVFECTSAPVHLPAGTMQEACDGGRGRARNLNSILESGSSGPPKNFDVTPDLGHLSSGQPLFFFYKNNVGALKTICRAAVGARIWHFFQKHLEIF